MASLAMSVNGMMVSCYLIEKNTVSIGRSSKNDIALDDPAVSSEHAVIFRDSDGNYEIMDQGSTNGTVINNKKVKKHYLKNDDIIRVGFIQFRFQAKDAGSNAGKNKKANANARGIIHLTEK